MYALFHLRYDPNLLRAYPFSTVNTSALLGLEIRIGPRMAAEEPTELKIVTSLNDVDLVSLPGFKPRRVKDVKLNVESRKNRENGTVIDVCQGRGICTFIALQRSFDKSETEIYEHT